MKNNILKTACLFAVILLGTQGAIAQCTSGSIVNGLYVNEFGQGDGGSEDWAELIAVEGSGGNLDLTGWIFDDNNNDVSGVGNADGFLIFDPTNDPTCAALSSVPSGTLIVVYNDGDPYSGVPADDLDPSDCTLVLPASSICFDANGANDYSMPADATASSWNLVGFRNGGDAVTTGTTAGIFHQLYYGDVDGTEVSSGGVQVDLPAVGGGDQAAFGCGSYGDDAEYTVSSAGTPAAGNGTENTDYVAAVKAGTLDCSDLEAACSAMVACPDLSTITAADLAPVITESTCEADNVTLSGGAIAMPATNPCPAGSTYQYSVDGGTTFLNGVPSYNQTTAISFKVRCTCDSDEDTVSAEADVATTPGVCPTCPTGLAALTAPAVVVDSESTCEADDTTLSGGVISAPATACPTGTTLEYSTDAGATWSETLPTYDQENVVTVETRCNCDVDNTVSSASSVVSTVPGSCPVAPTCTLPDVLVTAKCTDDSDVNDIEAGEDQFFVQIVINSLGSDTDSDDEVTVTVNGTAATYTAAGTYYVGPFNHSGTGTTTIPVSFLNDGESCSSDFVISEVICGYSTDGDGTSDGNTDDDLHASGPACDCDADPTGYLLAQVAPGSFDANTSVMVYILVDAAGNVVTSNNTGFFTGLTNQAYTIYPYNVVLADVATFTASIPASGSTYTGFAPPTGSCSAGCGDATFTLECECRVDDLAVMKTVNSAGPYAVGDAATYTITVLNQGTHPVYNISVADYLPTGLDFVQADNTGNDFSANSDTAGGGTVTAMVSTTTPVAPGGTYVLTVVLRVNASASSAASLTNGAEITGGSEDEAGTMAVTDEDDPLGNTGGGTEVDDNVADDASDDPNDQDDYDFAIINLCGNDCGTFPWNGTKSN